MLNPMLLSNKQKDRGAFAGSPIFCCALLVLKLRFTEVEQPDKRSKDQDPEYTVAEPMDGIKREATDDPCNGGGEVHLVDHGVADCVQCSK